jgi:hypothetical protein
MLLLNYVGSYLVRNLSRTCLTLGGVSIAIAAIVFAYGITGWLEILSSKSLESIVTGSTIWVVPPGSVRIDRDTGLVIANGSLTEHVIRALRDVDATVVLTRVIAAPVLVNGVKCVVYGAENVPATVVSPDLWKVIGARPGSAAVGGHRVFISAEDRALPNRSLQMPLATARTDLRLTVPASWVLADAADPVRWSMQAAKMQHLIVTDNPATRSHGDAVAIVYLVRSRLSRFDPFTFRTKFSALTLNSGMSTLFGDVARAVLFLGALLATASAMVAIKERREEVAIFSVTGLVSSFVVLLGIEAVLVQLISFAIGSVVALTLLRVTLASSYRPEIVAQAVAFAAIYVPAVIVITTLFPGQVVASLRPMETVRREL